MTSHPVSSTFLCSPLPSGTWQTPALSIPTSFPVCLVFYPLSLCPPRWLWLDLMNGRLVHTTSVCVSLRWSGGLRVVRLPAGSWHRLPTMVRRSLCGPIACWILAQTSSKGSVSYFQCKASTSVTRNNSFTQYSLQVVLFVCKFCFVLFFFLSFSQSHISRTSLKLKYCLVEKGCISLERRGECDPWSLVPFLRIAQVLDSNKRLR